MIDDLSKPGDAPVPPSALTIFGAGGDLTKRLLLPSLYNLASARVLPDAFRLVGVDKQDWDEAKFRDHIAEGLNEFWGKGPDPKVIDWLTGRATYQKADFDDPGSFDALKNTMGGNENRLFYLAVAPSFIGSVAAQLSRTGLLHEENGCWSRLVVEKPFGHDLDSAIALNNDLRSSLREDQIFRIDHFAGKDTVQDLAVFRFSNAIAEPLWNRSMIDNIQITVAETVGLENRAGYYEKSGALRDMVPNHLAEMLSLVAMEPPVAFNALHIRDKQVELLASVRKVNPEQVIRGQYTAGTMNNSPAAGYREEKGADPKSTNETYVAMRLEIENWRWAGVPFYLRTGKRLRKAVTEVVVTFRHPPSRLFPGERQDDDPPNRLVFNLKPTQAIRLAFGTKTPGLRTSVQHDSMEFQFPAGPFGDHATGYERLLHDAMTGEPMLFQRADFVEQGWRMVQPILDHWSQTPPEDFPNYAAGSNGPESADKLLAALGHAWHSLECA